MPQIRLVGRLKHRQSFGYVLQEPIKGYVFVMRNYDDLEYFFEDVEVYRDIILMARDGMDDPNDRTDLRNLHQYLLREEFKGKILNLTICELSSYSNTFERFNPPSTLLGRPNVELSAEDVLSGLHDTRNFDTHILCSVLSFYEKRMMCSGDATTGEYRSSTAIYDGNHWHPQDAEGREVPMINRQPTPFNAGDRQPQDDRPERGEE